MYAYPGVRNIIFRKILLTYLMDDPFIYDGIVKLEQISVYLAPQAMSGTIF